MGKKGAKGAEASNNTASKKGKEKNPPSEEEVVEEKPKIDDIEQSISELREKGKEDPESVDYVSELRKIQDQISDLKGENRRPLTAKPGEVEESEEEEEEEEEEEDPDKEFKELVNKRLTTMMMLALSYESDEQYPHDFYEKLGDSKKFKEVSGPITKEELKVLNQLLKDKKADAKKRMEDCMKSKHKRDSKK